MIITLLVVVWFLGAVLFFAIVSGSDSGTPVNVLVSVFWPFAFTLVMLGIILESLWEGWKRRKRGNHQHPRADR